MTDHPPVVAPMTRPGEVAGHPKLELRYRTEPERIAALLPPGFDPTGEPTVHINVYCVPVHEEPEYGVSTKIPARFDGIDGLYCLGIGIDQEAAIFISRETNGQPKFPCDVRFYRIGDNVTASATHQGRTFLEFSGSVSADSAPDGPRIGDEVDDNEWWIKSSRAVGGAEGQYDFPPHVVRVNTTGTITHVESLDGALTLSDSVWDPYTELLPIVDPATTTAALVTTRHTGRSISLLGPLDPEAFWPFADTIGGSRWPGERGGPRRTK